jgi:hypothetical protein
MRLQQRPGHLPGARLPGQLPGDRQPGTGALIPVKLTGPSLVTQGMLFVAW